MMQLINLKYNKHDGINDLQSSLLIYQAFINI